MFKLYWKNVPHYISLALAVIIFLTIPQIFLESWLSKKIDPLTDVNAVEFAHTPMDDYFYRDKNKVNVTYNVLEKEDSDLYNLEARYKWFVAKKDYEALYIHTGNGERIKEIIEDYFEHNPPVIVSEDDIDNLIKEHISTDYVDYSIQVVSREDYTRVVVTTYCHFCTRETDYPGTDYPISDYIYYES